MKKETKKKVAIYGGSIAIFLLWKSLSTIGKFSVIRYWVLVYLHGYWTADNEWYINTVPTVIRIFFLVFLLIIGPGNLYWFREYLWKGGIHSNSEIE